MKLSDNLVYIIALFLLALTFSLATFASEKSYVIINGSKVPVVSDAERSFKGPLKTLNQSNEKDGVLSVYIRGCGNLTVHKNSKGELPKPNSAIFVKFGSKCSIEDWKN